MAPLHWINLESTSFPDAQGPRLPYLKGGGESTTRITHGRMIETVTPTHVTNECKNLQYIIWNSPIYMPTWYNDDLDANFRLEHRAPVFISGGDGPSGTWLVVMTLMTTTLTSHPESPTTIRWLAQHCESCISRTLAPLRMFHFYDKLMRRKCQKRPTSSYTLNLKKLLSKAGYIT